MKTHNKYLFIESLGDVSVKGNVSNGYIESSDTTERIELPHNNYSLLGVVDECINAPYAEEFSKEIVDYLKSGEDGYGGYQNYSSEEWVYHLDTAKESFKTLMEKLELKQTDYILIDEKSATKE